jgi:hypothetical protein
LCGADIRVYQEASGLLGNLKAAGRLKLEEGGWLIVCVRINSDG